MRDVEATGTFWLPSEPENVFEGIFSFDRENGAKLTTTSTNFFDYTETGPGGFKFAAIGIGGYIDTQPVIYGFIDWIGEITLLDCKIYTQRIMPQSGNIIRPKYTVLGAELPTRDFAIDSVSFELTHLSEWLSSEFSFKVTHEKGESVNDTHHRASITIPDPQQWTYEFDDFSLRVATIIGRRWDGPGRYTIYQQGEIELSFKSTISLDDAINKHIDAFRRFLDFATDRTNAIVSLKAIYKTADNVQQEIEILFENKQPLNLRDRREIQSREDMVFSFSDVKDSLQTQYYHWINKADLLEVPIDLYLTTIHERLYAKRHLLLLTQALETYHRTIHGGHYIADEDEFDRIVKLMLDALPDNVDADYKNKLKQGTLKYSNEYSQRKRLKDILSNVLEPISFYIDDVIGDKNEIKIFVNRTVDTRNYFTHYGDMDETRLIPNHKVVSHIGKLSNILLCCLLMELEFSPEAIMQLLEANHFRNAWVRN